MDSDSQSDKPPQSHFSGMTNVFGVAIAFLTLAIPIISILLFSNPSTKYDPLVSFHEPDEPFRPLLKHPDSLR